MNASMIRFILAWVLKLEGVLMLLPALIAVVYQEKEGIVYLICALVAATVGQFLSRKPRNMEIYQKEGFLSVGLSWILLSFYGAIPFVATGEIPSYLNALFEIVSGFTTTGASILGDVEALSHASLFWRSFSHWIGGMGILVFVLMLIPTNAGGSHMNLMKAEAPGPEVSKFVPRVRGTARLLYKIYLTMTIVQFVLLLLTQMPWFDAICITFGTAGTGGFGVLNSSCASYTAAQQWIITIFMAAFGVNFAFYYLLWIRRAKDAFRMEEVRAYIAILVVAIGLVLWSIGSSISHFGLSLRDAAFQVCSIMTTTGFSTTDFNQWPSLAKTVLVLLMMIGACAGSTGGGLKVSRVMIMWKTVKTEIHKLLNPRSVCKLHMDGVSLEKGTRYAVYGFVVGYLLLFGVSVLVVSIDGFSFETNFTAVAATLNNIGPGLDEVGPIANYAHFGVLSKIVLILDMLAGRLELLPIFVILSPSTWKRT